MMKFLSSIVASLLIAQAAQATLIDLTPGGFDAYHPPPQPLLQLFRQTFFDQAAHGTFGGTYYDGWVSQYGLINGGTFFFSDLFGHDELSSNISWNMTGAPGGYWMTMIDVFGQAADGSSWENIYSVPFGDRFVLEDAVTLHDGVTISSIGFYGSNTIPDGGSTLWLFGIVWVIAGFIWIIGNRSYNKL